MFKACVPLYFRFSNCGKLGKAALVSVSNNDVDITNV